MLAHDAELFCFAGSKDLSQCQANGRIAALVGIQIVEFPPVFFDADRCGVFLFRTGDCNYGWERKRLFSSSQFDKRT